GGLTAATGQATVEVFTGLLGDLRPFEELFHQVDPATGAVTLVVELLIGRAGGGAETAVDTGPQNGLGLLPLRGIGKLLNEIGLHRVPALTTSCINVRD